MREILDIPARTVEPPPRDVLAAIGVPVGRDPGRELSAALADAVDEYRHVAAPRGLIQEVTSEQFIEVYTGQGRNQDSTPVSRLAPHATALALFAVTLGPEVGHRIEARFAARELVEATLLDAVASAAADLAADMVGRRTLRRMVDLRVAPERASALPFSPGYCGWHVSGQGRLFDALAPGEIGLTLRPSFLMEPLKSVSGVLIVGPRSLFALDPDYPACAECADQPCRGRMPLTAD